MKVAAIVLGALMLIGGMYCFITPIGTYAALGWLVGLAILVASIICMRVDLIVRGVCM